MTRYPHQLYISEGQAAILGTNGNWTAAAGSFALLCPCREEPGGGGGTVTLNDGTLRQFSSMIYLPAGITDVDVGNKIYVNGEDGTLRFTGEVLRVSFDQKHTTIWA